MAANSSDSDGLWNVALLAVVGLIAAAWAYRTISRLTAGQLTLAALSVFAVVAVIAVAVSTWRGITGHGSRSGPSPKVLLTLAATVSVLGVVALASTWIYRMLVALGAHGTQYVLGVVVTVTAVATATLTALARMTPVRILAGWRRLAHGLDLVQTKRTHQGDGSSTTTQRFPRMRMRPARNGWKITIRLLPGQVPDDIGQNLEGISHAWGIRELELTSPRLGQVQIRAYTRDPLEEPLEALPAPQTVDLAAVHVGRRQDGSPWLLKLLGAHVLVAGSTGSGKGSVIWSVIRALQPAVQAGTVRIIAIDPKVMELSYGRALFDAYAAGSEYLVKLLEAEVERMQERAERFAGQARNFTPTVDEPFVLVVLDELAFVTSYQPDRKLRERALAAIATLCSQGRSVGYCVLAALQDPRKSVVDFRGLFTTMVSLRLTEKVQVNMTLGEGALEAGARCHEISEALPGVGYVRLEGSRTVTRVRAAYVTDSDIAAMVADHQVPDAAVPALSLVKADVA